MANVVIKIRTITSYIDFDNLLIKHIVKKIDSV